MRIADILKAIASSPSVRLHSGSVTNDVTCNGVDSSYRSDVGERYSVQIDAEVMRALREKVAGLNTGDDLE